MLGRTAAYDVLTRIFGEVFFISFHCHSYQDHDIFLYQIPLIFPLEPYEGFYQLLLSFLLGPWVLYQLSLLFPLGSQKSSSHIPCFYGALYLFRSNTWSELYPLPWPQGNWTFFVYCCPSGFVLWNHLTSTACLTLGFFCISTLAIHESSVYIIDISLSLSIILFRHCRYLVQEDSLSFMFICGADLPSTDSTKLRSKIFFKVQACLCQTCAELLCHYCLRITTVGATFSLCDAVQLIEGRWSTGKSFRGLHANTRGFVQWIWAPVHSAVCRKSWAQSHMDAKKGLVFPPYIVNLFCHQIPIFMLYHIQAR